MKLPSFIGLYKFCKNFMHGKYEWYLYVVNILNIQMNETF
jgi:hypothetical protein